jgi:hypothetical protein
MSTKLFLLVLSVFFCLTEFASAGVMLYVHFGDSAPNVINEEDLVTSYTPNGDSHLTASIYLHLTQDSNLYHYRFSVRYNSELIVFHNRSQFRPDPFQPDNSVEYEYISPTKHKNPDPDPVSASSEVSDVLHGMDLYRFNGIIDTDTFSQVGFFKVATLTFSFGSQPMHQDDRLLLPGKFEFSPDDVNILDAFLGVDQDDETVPVEFSPSGGSVSISSVPEPTTALILGTLGVLALVRRNRPLTVKGI